MNCETAREQMGSYLDGELPVQETAALEQHLAKCSRCSDELGQARSLVESLAATDPCESPTPIPDVWARVEPKLNQARPPVLIRLFRRQMALAASLALLIGTGAFIVFWLNPAAQVAQANSIDYGLLLNGLSNDANAAVDRFLKHYQAVRMDPEAIAAEAPPMHFRIPDTLPGGYSLQESYRLRFGSNPGYAAKYRRKAGQPVFVFFHTPVNKTLLGVHRESHCSLAKGSHSVEVGPWQLIHFTDPTTCHCLLSSSADETELREMLAAISPKYPTTAN